ncbi:uncharacterized protein LOC135372647 isoform X2 [Ornithodoros turicata]|uniref:uncharacterized protein LOC135372647 isoform X2 n=2 Tax=Ornithodoros turicata TaxID=34597 RepID=UPI00313A12B3
MRNALSSPVFTHEMLHDQHECMVEEATTAPRNITTPESSVLLPSREDSKTSNVEKPPQSACSSGSVSVTIVSTDSNNLPDPYPVSLDGDAPSSPVKNSLANSKPRSPSVHGSLTPCDAPTSPTCESMAACPSNASSASSVQGCTTTMNLSLVNKTSGRSNSRNRISRPFLGRSLIQRAPTRPDLVLTGDEVTLEDCINVNKEHFEYLLDTPKDSLFCRDMVRALWSAEQLAERSLTGEACRRFLKQGAEGKRRLTPKKLDALGNAYWEYLKRRTPSSDSKEERFKMLPSYVRNLLSDINRKK